jgi:imidazole glycerol-phosphate synthase subunit HisF
VTRPRVVPVLLCEGGDLVVTRGFRRYRYAGDPLNCLRIFNEKEADEIMILDLTASEEGRPPDAGRIGRLASQCFMPVTYGGGIRTLAQAEALLRAGVERIMLTSAAIDYRLIADLSASFGAQSVVVGIDVVHDRAGRCWPAVMRARRKLGLELVDHVRRLRDAGAGEILLHAVDRDGRRSGYDLDLVRAITGQIDVPVVILGGARGLPDFRAGLSAGASAVAGGACFMLHGRHEAVLITYPTADDIAGLCG